MTDRRGASAREDPHRGETESRVIRLSRNRRVAKLLGLQGITHDVTDSLTGETTRQIDGTFLYYSIASFLASKHFNERNGSILPHLPYRLQNCDFYWGYEYRDGQQEGFEATRQFLLAMDSAYYHKYDNHAERDATRAPATNHHLQPAESVQDNSERPGTITIRRGNPETTDPFDRRLKSHNDTVVLDEQWNWHSNQAETAMIQRATKYLEPFAVYGAWWSQVTKVVGAVTGAMEIPYISGASHSKELEGQPFFARTSPNNDGDARTIMVYYQSLGISHLAVLYLRDTWGINYHASLRRYASGFGIEMASFAYDPNEESIDAALDNLRDSEYRYVYGVLHDGRDVLPMAYRKGIVGNPGYAWIMAEGLARASGGGYELDGTQDHDLAMALHGVGVVNGYKHGGRDYGDAMAEFATNKELQEEFIAIQDEPELFENYTFPEYVPSIESLVVFDAVMALGVAACDPSLPDLFTGTEFFDTLLHTEFNGVSGRVQFDPKTGSRLAKHVKYSVDYLVIDEEQSTDDFIILDSQVSAIIKDKHVVSVNPFLYNDNSVFPYGTTTTPPLTLPAVEDFNLNKIPDAALVFGYVCAAMIIVSSVICFTWTLFNRKLFSVRASQPFFLCQLCVGIFITGWTCIPWSFALSSDVPTEIGGYEEYYEFKDPGGLGTKGLDFSCNCSPWLLCIGHAVTFSALTSKTWRINQVLSTGAAMRRSKVGIKEAIAPLYGSLTINIGMLLCIALLAPLQYERISVDNFDHFGRSLESYGVCQPSNDMFFVFLGVLMVSNFLGLLVVTREAYRGRHAPTLFSDAQYLAWALMCILETVVMGGPIFFAVDQDPTAFYVSASLLLLICCMAILVLLFYPKFLARNQTQASHVVVTGLPQHANSMENNADSAAVHQLDASGTSSMETSLRSSHQQHGFMQLTRHSS